MTPLRLFRCPRCPYETRQRANTVWHRCGAQRTPQRLYIVDETPTDPEEAA